MSKKINYLSNCDIIGNIANQMENPLFIYDKLPNFEDIYNNVKKHPLNLTRIINCLSLFFILNVVYFWIIQKYLKFSFLYYLIVPILFLVSVLWTIKKTKKNIFKIITMSNAKFYFYDNFLIIKSDNSLEQTPYNKILLFKEGKTIFSFATKSRSFIIEKNKIDDKFYNFLKRLTKQYKNIKTSSNDKLFWDCLHKHMGKYKLYCVNNKNEKTLDKYYHTKKVFKIFYIYILCINFIIVLSVFSAFGILFKNSIEFIFYMIFIIILTIFCMPNHIKYRIKRILQKKEEKLYFYDEFFLIKTEEIILKYEYNDIKSFTEDDEIIFIKVKSLISPIVINKQISSSMNFNLSKKIKTSIK